MEDTEELQIKQESIEELENIDTEDLMTVE